MRRGWLLVLAVAATGCSGALNYLDPAGPIFQTAASTTPPAPPEADVPVRIVTFNIEHGMRLDAALRVLKEEAELARPDLLALQEMDPQGVERMAHELGMNAVYFPSGVHPKHKRDFGCAVLSPWPLVEPRKVLLPHAARGTGLRRAATGATLLRGEDRLRVYSVHLPSPQGVSGGSRQDQIATLLADAATSEDPVVIVGDFNAHGIGRQFVRAGYLWLTRDVGATLSKVGLKLSYDHVFARGLTPAVPAAGVIRDNRGASDHQPVWVRLLVAPKQGD